MDEELKEIAEEIVKLASRLYPIKGHSVVLKQAIDSLNFAKNRVEMERSHRNE